jgi:hypothetical protein
MPKAVGVTYEDFCRLEKDLKKKGFREITGREVINIVIAHGLKALKVIIEGEVGFQYSENGYTVKVWTTCLRSKVRKCRLENSLFSGGEVVSRPSGEDMGWVLIVDSTNKAKYFAKPVLRTKNFIKTLYQRTLISTIRVQKRPLCMQCGCYMHIFRKKSKATYWVCWEKFNHAPKKPLWKNWDFPLGPRAMKIVKAWRREYRRYLDAKRAKGEYPTQARFIRKSRYVATKNPY